MIRFRTILPAILLLLLFLPFRAFSQVIIPYGRITNVKAEKIASEPRVFKEYGLQMIVPDGWEVINPESSPYYLEDSFFKLNISNQNGGMAWIWRDKVYVEPYSKDVLEDIVFEFSPNIKHLRTYEIKGSAGPNTRLYVWEAKHIKNGEFERFKLFAALNEAPVFKPRLQNAVLIGRSADLDTTGVIEADFLSITEYLKTYNESKKGDDFETHYQFMDRVMDEALYDAFKDYEMDIKVDFAPADSLEEPASFNGRSMEWRFQSYPGWSKDDRIVEEDSVDWMVPSIIESDKDLVNDFVQISTDHLLNICSRGIFMVNSAEGELQWYKKIGYRNFNFAAGNDKQIIITSRGITSIIVKSLKTLTGNEHWSTEIFGNTPIDFHIDLKSNSFILVQYYYNQTLITSLDLDTGDQRWTISRDHVKGFNSPPLPHLNDSRLLTYCNGFEAISLLDGETLWKNDEISLDESSPEPRVFDDTLLVIGSDNSINIISASSGHLINSIEGRKKSEYTNIYILNNRLYLRGKTVDANEEDIYYLDVFSGSDFEPSWSYTDTLPTISGIIENGTIIYTSFWNGPIAFDKHTGKVHFRSVIAETGQTYPVSIRLSDDTLVYVGEHIVAGVNSNSGIEIFKTGSNPQSQTKNLDGIDPQIIKHYDHLKFFGKPGLKEVTPEMGNVNILFNLSAASQERATQLYSMSRSNASMYRYTGYDTYYYKSRLQANQAQISNAFSRAYANSALLLGSVNRAATAVSKMTKQERDRLSLLNERRIALIKLYDVFETDDYVIRRSEVSKGAFLSDKLELIYLLTGEVVWTIDADRILNDIILDTERNMIYYHERRIVPELFEFSRNSEDGTAAHAYYLVALPFLK